MSVTATNLILGPATIYTGAFGATEPADTSVASDVDAMVWTDLGGTTDGLMIDIDQQFTELGVDQVVDRVGSRLTKRDTQFSTNLAEATLENLAIALNGGTVSSGSGFKKYEPNAASSATQPTYKALIVDGYAPGGFRRRIIARRVLNIAKVSFAYKKDTQSVFSVAFTAHYVSASVAPYAMIDGV